MPMTKDELHDEWVYRFQERLGLLIDGVREPVAGEKDIARKDADEAVRLLTAPSESIHPARTGNTCSA